MRRIVEETLSNGERQYRVESNRRLFGLLKCKWYTETVAIPYMEGSIHCAAVFKTLREAQAHCGINPNPVVSRKIVAENG